MVSVLRTQDLYYKTFNGRNLRILILTRVYVFGKHFQPSLVFSGEAGSLPESGAHSIAQKQPSLELKTHPNNF
jgi:hypothetical protein